MGKISLEVEKLLFYGSVEYSVSRLCAVPSHTVPNRAAFRLSAFIYETVTWLLIFVSENVFHPRVSEEKTPMNSEQAWCHTTKYDFGILMAVSEISCICGP